MLCNKDHWLYSYTQEMLLSEGLYWINTVKQYCRIFLFAGLGGHCWIGRWDIENVRFDNEVILVLQRFLYSHMCRISGFVLWGNFILRSMKLSSLIQCIFKQRLPSVLFTLPFTLSHILWIVYGHISPAAIMKWMCFGHRVVSMQREKQRYFMEVVEDPRWSE